MSICNSRWFQNPPVLWLKKLIVFLEEEKERERETLPQINADFPTSGYVTEGGASVTHRKRMKTDSSPLWSAIKLQPDTRKAANVQVDISI